MLLRQWARVGLLWSVIALHPVAGLAAEIIIDNGAAGFTVTGEWPPSTAVAGYYGANYLFAPPGDTPGGTIVDNTDPEVSVVGAWTTGSSTPGYWGTNYHSHAAGSGTETFTWTLSVPATGSYKVFARWAASANRANAARYTVNHAGGATVATVNQQTNGGRWNLLGTFSFNAGNATVSLSDQANGYVIADAIKIVEATAAPSAAQWTVATAGQYQVHARWTAYPNRATDATYTVTHTGGSTPVTVNQQSNGGQWNLLGTFTFSAGQYVTLTTAASGDVIADAIRLVSATQQTMYFIHADHLNTPRLITDQQGQAVWSWANDDPFGANAPNENPAGLGNFTCNLRLPGQYFDQETGLHYGGARDYDSGIGAFIQPEPLGLAGDINLYRYARSNPLSFIDPDGKQAIPFPGGGAGAGIGGLGGFRGSNPFSKPKKPTDPLSEALGEGRSTSSSSSSSSSDAARARCEAQCDKDYDFGQAQCEAWWKTTGRDPSAYRVCMDRVRANYIKCYQDCANACK